ncbi:MAG: aminotransferase class III-fold pyridoxal phosphate-dependent enzyme [Anaerolineales bacterium]|jgi:4-aminobutyrate aminotransferase-like enzyme/Ser/Thr protein kinase RdoA (MazF antagonist)
MEIVFQPNPGFTPGEAIRITKDLFGLAVTARGLPSERDQNFLVETGEGERYILKIANPGEDPALLDLQNQAMAHISAHSVGDVVPRIIPSVNGDAISVVEKGGERYWFRLVTYLPGTTLANTTPRTPELLRSLGGFMGKLGKAMKSFSHPAARRDLKWDLKHALWIEEYLEYIEDENRREIVEDILDQYKNVVVPAIPHLSVGVIHNDGNDHNLIVDSTDPFGKSVTGVIDFGDMVETYTVCDLAIAAAYGSFEVDDPLMAAAEIVSGYHVENPLSETEIDILYLLILTRLAVSVTNSAYQKTLEPERDYLTISEFQAWEVLEKLADIPPRLAHYTFRHACGLPPCPRTPDVVEWLRNVRAQHAAPLRKDEIGPVIEADWTKANVYDLGVGGSDVGMLEEPAEPPIKSIGIGRYNQPRFLYTSEDFSPTNHISETPANLHMGIDLFVPPGTPILAPLDGTVYAVKDRIIVLQHEFKGGKVRFYSLYKHACPALVEGDLIGKDFKRGEVISRVCDLPEDAILPSHLHVQLITDLLDMGADFPPFGEPSRREVWLSLCPDPNLLLGIPQEIFPSPAMSSGEILYARQEILGPSLSIAYKEHLNIVRGVGQYLFDERGRAYLDCVNNVPHVGHCHPKVVEAAQKQTAVLNTNTRYLHEDIVELAERILALMPDPLGVCFFVCSGSEANELALRLAWTHTGQQNTIVVDNAYHGNTNTLVEISPYKFNGPGGKGKPDYVNVVSMPDTYRGVYRAGDPQAGVKYAQEVGEVIRSHPLKKPTFIHESLLGVGGQVVLPEGYLQAAYEYVRDIGGVCIADEVQVGFGRVGTHFWGFETQGVAPDIVTLGKPMGNGHPLAAVVTTREIAASFDNGMEYFNTFGGNPVSCVVGLAVLDVIEEEGLQANALEVGSYLKAGLAELKAEHTLIGDVRGLGLFIGVELVRDRKPLEPAYEQAAYIIERMKDKGFLLSVDGPLHNVLKIKPPIVFSKANTDALLRALDQVFGEDYCRNG